MSLYKHVPHARIERRKKAGPVKTADQHGSGFNARLALKITAVVGSVGCAYAFAALALISLPAAIGSGSVIIIVAWIAQTFLQLVLLSVILLGQNITSAASDARAEATYADAEAVLAECLELQAHLAAQDDLTQEIHALLKSNTELTEQVHALVQAKPRTTAPKRLATAQEKKDSP